jgi:hypothetical protein
MSTLKMILEQNVALVLLCMCTTCEGATSLQPLGGDVKAWIPHDSPDDISSFILTGTDVKSSPAGMAAPQSQSSTMTDDAPVESTEELAAWESAFAKGVMESKALVDGEDCKVGSWTVDSESGGSIPRRMLQAEELLQAGMEEAPADSWKAKAAEKALRIYYHAKWLAERNYARAAEHRYRAAAELARKCRRSVLASHSLARLGYFMVQWNRHDEAAEVLKESIDVNLKSNPLAPFLHGVLERKAAGGDVERLKAAEEYILNSDEQPSDELEFERQHLISQISYWRQAETSSKHCFASADSAYILICLCGHAVLSFRRFFGF